MSGSGFRPFVMPRGVYLLNDYFYHFRRDYSTAFLVTVGTAVSELADVRGGLCGDTAGEHLRSKRYYSRPSQGCAVIVTNLAN